MTTTVRPAPSPTATAADVMSAPVMTVAPDTMLWAAWDAMARTGLRHLVVTVDSRCIGLLDERSVLMTWPTWPVGPAHRCVADVMRHPVHCVYADAPVCDIAALMLRERVQAVPVVDVRQAVIGLVTVTDLLRLLAPTQEGPTSDDA